MNIGILFPSGYAVAFPTDGRRIQIIAQAAAMQRLGHSVTFLPPWETTELSPFDVLHIVEGSFGNFVATHRPIQGPKIFALAPFIDSNQPNWRYHIMAWLGSRRGPFVNAPGVYYRQFRNVDLICARSSHEKSRILEGIGVGSRTRVEIIPNGTDPPASASPDLARSKFNLPDKYLLFVGDYGHPRKNIERLLAAIEPLGYPLVIAGIPCDTPARHRIEAAVKKSNRLHILGYLDQHSLDSLYAGCHVFCLPSIHEGTGLSALEAAGQGAGIVITKYGGPPDYFNNLAYYVDPYDVISIRNAIQSAWQNPRGPELKSHILNKLSWEHSAQSLVEAFQRAINAKSQ